MKKQATILILTIFAVLMLCGAVSAATVDVTPGQDIQTAINTAGADDTIIVHDNSGTPYTYATTNTVNVPKTLNITASGDVTVQTSNTATPVFEIYGAGSGTTLQGFKIQGATDSAGVWLSNVMNVKIQDNIITNCLIGVGGVGVPATPLHDTEITGNTITTTSSTALETNGIHIVGSDNSHTTISGNTITATSTGTGACYAILFYEGSDNIVDNNRITANTASNIGTGIEVGGCTNTQVTRNLISVNGPALSSINGIMYDGGLTGLTITGNSISSSGNGIYATITGCTAHFNRIIAGDRVIVYVPQGSTMNAEYNWYGSNTPAASQFGGSVDYNPWLIMIVSASPTTIYTGGTSTVTADFTYDSDHLTNPSTLPHNPTLGHFPDGFSVLFQSTGGSISAGLPTSNGVATAIFTADSGPGLGVASGSLDSQPPLPVNINILQLTSSNGQSNSQGSDPTNNQVNAASSTSTNTVGMQNTGIPIAGIVLAVLLMFAGMVIPRKK